MRYTPVLAMFALALAAVFAPLPAPAGPDPIPGLADPPISVCPIVEAGGRQTVLSILSSVNGEGRLSAFASGTEPTTVDFRTGGSGSTTIDATEVGALGIAGGLIEMPSDATATGVTIRGTTSLAAESCDDIPTGQSFVTGGSTATGASFEIQLMNPYAGEALVDLTVVTETGIESDSRFDAIVVPALSSVTIDMAQVIPGRERLSVTIDTMRGSILAVARQTTDAESALWRAVAPDLNWWLPIPPGGDVKELVIGSPSVTDIEYQVDLYGPDGVEEGFQSGVLPARGQVVMPLTDVTTDAIGVRVVTSAPVVSTLWIEGELGLAATTGSSIDAPVWLLPGASMPAEGSATIVVFNPGLDPVNLSVRALKDQSVVTDHEVAAEGVLVIELGEADGYRVEGSAPVVVLWASQAGGAGTVSLGIPIQDE